MVGFLAGGIVPASMRVAFVSLETTRQVDDAGQRRFERVARLLADRGHDVTLYCGQWWDDYTDVREVEGLRYRGVTLGTAASSFVARLPALLAAHRPDVIHVQPAPADQVLAALVGGSLARAPVVVEWFGSREPAADRRLSRFTVTRPARIITPSEYVRTRVRERGADGDRTRVIPESIDYDRVEAAEPADPVDVAFAHPMNGTSNLDDLILGLAELRKEDWSATIIGDGPLREEYERDVSNLRIDDRVQFVGNCDRERRLEIYRGAHAFVQTATREQFPRELLWALAAGCVGIVEYQAESGAHELIENYERSFRVTDPEQLAGAIRDARELDRWTSDDHWAAYDHGTILNRYLDVYREVTDEYGWL